MYFVLQPFYVQSILCQCHVFNDSKFQIVDIVSPSYY